MFGSPFLVELDGVEVEFEFGEPNGAGEYQVWERGTAPALTTPCPQCGHGMYRGTVLIGLVEENDVHAEYSCMPCGRRFRRPNSDAAWEPA
jgi:DNA-directed RNA polymerase subunit RPC12/RpoP